MAAGFAGAFAGAGASAGGTATAGQAGGSGAGGAMFGGSGAGLGGSAGMAVGLAEVQPIFDAHCVICHDKAKMGLPTFGQLSLLPGDAWSALVGKPASETCGGRLVVAGDADHSYLWHKLTDGMPCDGQKMPRAFEILPPAPLTADELATLRAWIAGGATE